MQNVRAVEHLLHTSPRCRRCGVAVKALELPVIRERLLQAVRDAEADVATREQGYAYAVGRLSYIARIAADALDGVCSSCSDVARTAVAADGAL